MADNIELELRENEESTRILKIREDDKTMENDKKSKYLGNIIDRKNVEIYNIYIQLKMNIRIARKLSELSTDIEVEQSKLKDLEGKQSKLEDLEGELSELRKDIDSVSLPVSIVYNGEKYIYKDTFDKHLKSINLLKKILIEEEEEEKDTKTQLKKDENNKLLLPKYIYDNKDNPEFIEAGINLMKHAPRSEEGMSLYDVLCEDLAYTLDKDFENDKGNLYNKGNLYIKLRTYLIKLSDNPKTTDFVGSPNSDRTLFMDLLDKQRKLFDEEKKKLMDIELTGIELVNDLKNKFRIVKQLGYESKTVKDITTLTIADKIEDKVIRNMSSLDRFLSREESSPEYKKYKDIYIDLFYSTMLLSTELYKPHFFFDEKIYYCPVLKEKNPKKYRSHINNIRRIHGFINSINGKGNVKDDAEGNVKDDAEGNAELVRIYNIYKISINKSIQYLIDNAPKSREGISLYDAINKTGEAVEAREAAKARAAAKAEEAAGTAETAETAGTDEGAAAGTDEEAAAQGGGKRKSKGKSKKVANKPVVSQKKQSIYKEIFGKQMKIYKMPDSRKEYVKYKGELLHISDYKDLMKQKAMVKTKTKTKETKATQQKAIAKTKAKATKATKETNVTQQKVIAKTKTNVTKETKATQQKAKAKSKAKK